MGTSVPHRAHFARAVAPAARTISAREARFLAAAKAYAISHDVCRRSKETLNPEWDFLETFQAMDRGERSAA